MLRSSDFSISEPWTLTGWPEGYPQIRVYHKKGAGNRMPRYLLKCGCCDEKLEIYYRL